ncbi:MAG: hypothetical protein P0116_15850 [Candidatus Nitrosocosmicus sp.]|nr:hypothetical protein [Candidatus Nitrosocosmicus sp.]
MKIHKISKINNSSLGVILPQTYSKELSIGKGDFVEINKENDMIIIKKLRVMER